MQLPHCILLKAKTLPLEGASVPGDSSTFCRQMLAGPAQASLVVQDTTLANQEAWAGLANSPAVQDEDEGMQEAGDDADGLWNNFQSQDDAEREQVSMAFTPLHAHLVP